jgi:uncharacterized damage-inducible protein DinB
MQTDLIDRYEQGAELLRYAVQGLTDDQRHARPGPGAWSLAEVVAHLVDSDAVGLDRMKRLIAEQNPTLQSFDESAWAARLDYDSLPMEEGTALFAANRKWMTRILRKCSEADFARTGTHTEAGVKSLAEVLAGFVAHLDAHLKFVYAKRANLGVTIYPRYSRD